MAGHIKDFKIALIAARGILVKNVLVRRISTSWTYPFQGLQYMPGQPFCRYMSYFCTKAISDFDRKEYSFIHCNSGCTGRATLPFLPAAFSSSTIQPPGTPCADNPTIRWLSDNLQVTLKTRLHILSSGLNVQPDCRVIEFQRNGQGYLSEKTPQ